MFDIYVCGERSHSDEIFKTVFFNLKVRENYLNF